MARFVLANRRGGLLPQGGEHLAAVASAPASEALDIFPKARSMLEANFSLHSFVEPHATSGRWQIQIDGDARDLQSAIAKIPGDVIAEPALSRSVATVSADGLLSTMAPNGGDPPSAGIGADINITLQSVGRPVVGAQAALALADTRGTGLQTMISGQSDTGGKATLHYDPKLWQPILLMIQPLSGCWGAWQTNPSGNIALDLPALPKTGPIGWWHLAANISQRRKDRAAGIRIGIVDSGVGPHPYLAHVRSIGSVTGAQYDARPEAGADVLGHGTHVSGIIGARPVDGSGDYAGLAEGAEILMIRVFPKQGDANQGDIAEAIERLAMEKCDLINLSLGGAQPSDIERDAVRMATGMGSLCIAAAGNNFGQPIMYPAAYPEVAAISAVGVVGAYPPGTMEAQSLPYQPDRYGFDNLFLGNFSNIGSEMTGTAPGVGIISTVPARPEVAAPYAAQSGTSMAAPIATAALASVLAQDEVYRGLPRDQTRVQRASTILAASLRPLGLNPVYVGIGLSQGWPN